ncbi:hypothetical protein ACFL2V_13635 [Pseudomonadota bacterium]
MGALRSYLPYRPSCQDGCDPCLVHRHGYFDRVLVSMLDLMEQDFVLLSSYRLASLEPIIDADIE